MIRKELFRGVNDNLLFEKTAGETRESLQIFRPSGCRQWLSRKRRGHQGASSRLFLGSV